ncbi:MAG: hypothetical protein EXQ87_12515 [Alphaproteobacteria bacterium]|nr:hypothetical protein [Alphaproteobacteria bacterium]
MSAIEDLYQSDPAIIWAGIGVALLIVEVLAAGGFFVSFAVAAFLVSAASWAGIMPRPLLWNMVIVAAMGIVLTPILRALLRKYSNRTPDINQY